METLVVHPKDHQQQDLLEAIFREMKVSFEREKSSVELSDWQKKELEDRSTSNEGEFVSSDMADKMAAECFR